MVVKDIYNKSNAYVNHQLLACVCTCKGMDDDDTPLDVKCSNASQVNFLLFLSWQQQQQQPSLNT